MSSNYLSNKNSVENIPTNRASNIFFNITIFLLSVVVAFLSYSIISKLNNYFSGEESEEKIVVTSKPVQLEVLNGCGVKGIADRFTDYLRSSNFDVVNIGNYRSFDIDNSLIIDRTGNYKNALKLASLLGVEDNQIIQQVNKNYFLDITLIIGKDHKQLFTNKRN